jgi:hypothetical protein
VRPINLWNRFIKSNSTFVKRKNKELIKEEEFITEEELIGLVDCGIFAILEGEIEWFTSVGCAIDVLRKEGLLEQYCFTRWYLSEIKKYITNELTRHHLEGL